MSKRLRELQQRRAEAFDAADAIVNASGSEPFTEADQQAFDKHMGEVDQLDADIARLQQLESARDEIDPAPEAEQPATRNVGPAAKREFESLGEFMHAAVKNPDDPRLDYQELSAEQRTDEGSAGGFAIPTQWRGEIMRIEPSEAVVAGRSNVLPAGTPPDSEITMPALDQTGATPQNVYGGVQMSWIGEGDMKPETGANLRNVTLKPQELAGHIPVTDKLLRNWMAASSVLEGLMRGALSGAVEDAVYNGDGVAKPMGILKSGATYKVNRTTANTVTYADVCAMLARALMRGGQLYWTASQSIMIELLQMTNNNGQYIWKDNAVEGSPGSLMGYPVFWSEYNPQLGNFGDLSLLNTNPYYLIKEGSGPFVDTGFAGNDFVNNKRRIKIFTNVDGQSWLTEPFKQRSGYEVSPFVALDVPA